MIRATQQGRRLVLTVLDEDGRDAVPPFLIDPVSAKVGRAMSFRYLTVLASRELPEGESIDADLATALGQDNLDRLEADEVLSIAEVDLISQSGYLWQMVGGLASVEALLKVDAADSTQGGVDALGEALKVFRLRMAPYLSRILRPSESEHPTPSPADSPATSTPQGGESSERPPVSDTNSEPESTTEPIQLRPRSTSGVSSA